MMTRLERLGKQQVLKVLNENGYPTYGELFDLFDLHLTEDPDVVGYMEPGKATITVNKYLDIDQVSMVVRHEILHEFLNHQKRLEKMGRQFSDIANIAGDYEISNVGYTDADKRNARALNLNGRILKGLVTEDDHPDWVDLSFEEMVEKLEKESPESLKNPQIGNKGSQQLQEAEDQARRAEKLSEDQSGQGQSSKGQSSGDQEDDDQGEGKEKEGEGGGSGKKRNKYDDEEYQKMSPEEKRKERARRRKEAAKQLKEAADKLIDEIKGEVDKGGPGDTNQKASNQEVFDTPEEQADLQRRLTQIKKILNDLEKGESAKSEAQAKVLEERAAKAAKDADRYRNSPIVRFTESLNRFIRNAVARGKHENWARINKKYVYSGLMKPGQSYNGKNKVPLINVYFDRSGSWNESKTAIGRQAIATLNRYVTRGELKIDLYYFSVHVHSDEGSAIAEGGTNGQPILDHIEQTRPDNVIIMTDSDITDCRSDVTIPGMVWFLFVGGRSQNLMEHLKGARGTEAFDLESR